MSPISPPGGCRSGHDAVIRNPLAVNALLIVVIIWVVMQVKSADIQPFIYFQF